MVAACNTIPLNYGTEYRGSNPALADFQPRPVVPVAAAYEQTQNLQRLFSAEVDGIARGGVDWKFAAAMGGGGGRRFLRVFAAGGARSGLGKRPGRTYEALSPGIAWGYFFVVSSYVARLRWPGSFLRIGDVLRRLSAWLLQRSMFQRRPGHGSGRAFLSGLILPEH